MPRKPKYQVVHVVDDTWYALGNFDRDICCLCSAVHDSQHKLENGRIFSKTKLNMRETNKLRKAEGIQVIRAIKTAE